MKPEISIVMTNHNKADFIGEAIQSVLDQTFKDWELIIVDDASTDKSVEKVRTFKDERIRLEILERNGHVSNAHNVGNALCRGRYIAMLDSDDVWTPDKLERQFRYMEEHPDTGLCFTMLEIINENSELSEDQQVAELFREKNRSREEWLRYLLMTGNHFAKDSVLMRRDVVDEVGDNDLCMLQLHDYDYWMRALRHFSLHVIDEPMLKYRRIEQAGAISSQTGENTNRLIFEYSWIIAREIREMSDDAFLRVFSRELTDPDAQGHNAVCCEKAILLSSDIPAHPCRAQAFEMFGDILGDSETRKVLAEKYGMDQHDVYRLTGMPIIWDSQLMREKDLLQDELAMLKAEMEMMKNSKSWRYTEFLRSTGRSVRSAIGFGKQQAK